MLALPTPRVKLAEKWAFAFPLLVRLSLLAVCTPPPLALTSKPQPPLEVRAGVAGVPWTDPPPSQVIAFATAVRWRTVGLKQSADGKVSATYLCIQDREIKKELKAGSPARELFDEVERGALAVAGPDFENMGGYGMGHFEGGGGLDDHADKPVQPEISSFRMTRRITSAPLSSMLRLKNTATKEEYALLLEKGYNLFEGFVLGLGDSPWQHGAPAMKGVFSISFVWNFKARDKMAHRSHVTGIVSDYHERASLDATLRPAPPMPLAPPPSVDVGSEITITAVAVSHVSSMGQRNSNFANAVKDAVNLVLAEAKKTGEKLTNKQIASRAGIGEKYVEGVFRKKASAPVAGE